MILPLILCDKHILTAELSDHNIRLDRLIIKKLPSLSRTSVQKTIEQGNVCINNTVETRPGKLVLAGDTITIMPSTPPARPFLQQKDVDTFFREAHVSTHEHFFVLNKPAGLVCHPPSPTSKEAALSDYVTTYDPSIKLVGEPLRPGIVHRLDTLTSGLILIARTPHGYTQLKELFSNRLIKKTYYALVVGSPPNRAVLTDPLVRDPLDPRRMICSLSAGAPAETHIETIERTENHALIKAMPRTGRTHQIRVHCAYHGYPIKGDSLYGKEDPLLKRQALHAAQLSFVFEGQNYSYTAPLPEELALQWNSCKLKR